MKDSQILNSTVGILMLLASPILAVLIVLTVLYQIMKFCIEVITDYFKS